MKDLYFESKGPRKMKVATAATLTNRVAFTVMYLRSGSRLPAEAIYTVLGRNATTEDCKMEIHAKKSLI